jgi:hypothetical protein
MPDLRYHLISLISVFLALAIGILLGVAMADRGVVSDRMQAEITSIQQELARQESEIDEQNEQIGEQEVLLEQMSEVMIVDSLQGREVALVAGPYAESDVFRVMQGDLSEAGASITTIETLEPPEPDELPRMETTSRGGATTSLEAEYTDVARRVMGYTDEIDESPDIVIFLGGGKIPEEAPPDTSAALRAAQTELFEVWLDAGVRVVGAEPSEAGRSEIPLFQNVGISSVVYADQPAGRAAIIECAAAENCEGTFGMKDRASEPFPSPS